MGSVPEAQLFGFSVERWPRLFIMLVGASGIFISFLLDGIAHEHLISQFSFNDTFFLTLIQFIGYSALSFPTLIQIVTGKVRLRAHLGAYLVTSGALAFSMSLTNFAAVRLSYATGILFKSSKLIPVLIGNVIFLKKRPKISEVIAVMLIVLGLIGISLGDVKGKNKFDSFGIVAISVSLICGAIASNMEDKVMSHYEASQDEVISMIYGIGSLIMAVLALVTGDMKSGIQKIVERPDSLIYIGIFSVLGALGIQFVYLVMKVFGSLVTVMITSVRKALTVCLSFVIFKDKVFTLWHAGAMMLIAAGMSINVYDKTAAKKKQALEEQRFLDHVGSTTLAAGDESEADTDA
jgi:adenosine 3'-phospho 5'-phosphosulfate transporter B3